ncbi:MAG TPA: MFS transporter, partial [Actinomycetota bacterium]
AGYGLLMAFRGIGALIGPFLGHRLAGPRHQRLFDAIAIALAVFGLSYMALGLMPSLWLGAIAVLCAHLGGGAQWVLSTYGLQRIVPDRIRGRIFAADYALITLTLTGSALVASLLADAIGPREAVAIVGGIALVWAAVWWSLTRSIGRTLDLGGPAAPEPSGPPAIAPP